MVSLPLDNVYEHCVMCSLHHWGKLVLVGLGNPYGNLHLVLESNHFKVLDGSDFLWPSGSSDKIKQETLSSLYLYLEVPKSNKGISSHSISKIRS